MDNASVRPLEVARAMNRPTPSPLTHRSIGHRSRGRARLLLVSCVAGACLLLAPVASADGHGQGKIPRSERPADARLYIISPENGATVKSPVEIRFGLGGMGVAPAGVEKKHTGHHHLVVDAPLPPAHLPIPKNENYRHFGGGQTEVSLELAPGEHTLQLVLGDHLHIPHDPPVVSEKIRITVVE